MAIDLTLEIEDVGPISQAKIDIGKINIIGGKNSTGKSTSSKLLYCFLRANYDHNEDLIVRAISPRLRRFASDLEKYEIIPDELYKPIYELAELSVDEIIKYYDELKIFYYEFEGECIAKSHEDWIKTRSEDIDLNVDISESAALQFLRDKSRLQNHIERIDEMVNVEKNPNRLFQYLIKGLISNEFDLRMPIFSHFGKKISFSSKDLNLNWEIDFKKDLYEKNGIFNIENIFYLDSFSVLDLPQPNRSMNRIPMRSYGKTDHVRKLSENIFDESEVEVYFDEIDNKEIIEIEKKVKNIIGGSIEIDRGVILYKTADNSWHSMFNTASGIKQIGVVQKLLSNRKLKPQSFLIIDEPEVNLHPEWQVKFAEILVLLASDLDINIYINTHSPMFIEAMSLYSEYYGLLDETYVYLSKEDLNFVPREDEGRYMYNINDGEKIALTTIDNSPKFTFEKIDPKDMGAVYENLSRPYDDLDDLKSKILFKNS